MKGGSACQWSIERRWRSGIDSLNPVGRKSTLRFAQVQWAIFLGFAPKSLGLPFVG